MRFRVYLLRYCGHRLPWRDVVNGPKYVGDLISEQVTVGDERYEVLTLRSEDPAMPSPIAPLYEPVLLGFFTLALRLRGFESVNRGTGTFGVVQEWHCELP
jgi:hypothetical protein